MYQPKFKIGQEICSKEYGIEYAIISGVRVYFETNYNTASLLPMTLEHWLDNTNNCDYDIIYDDSDGVLVKDCFTERFLESYSNDE
jgi:hypothetical protein